MLTILDQRAAAENLPITSHLLAWDEDWSQAGLGENSVDLRFRFTLPDERQHSQPHCKA